MPFGATATPCGVPAIFHFFTTRRSRVETAVRAWANAPLAIKTMANARVAAHPNAETRRRGDAEKAVPASARLRVSASGRAKDGLLDFVGETLRDRIGQEFL